jgi:hypothetical protein
MKKREKTVNWAEKVTLLYEKVTKNDPFNAAMDLHNNAVGRNLFLNETYVKSPENHDILLKMMEKAVKIREIEQFELFKDQLVYITE